MMRALRVVALDLSPAATAIARTHDGRGEPSLSVATIPDTDKRPLHQQINVIEFGVRRACGVSPRGGAPVPGLMPDVVTIENTFSRPGASDYPLHALQAVVRQWLFRVGIPYVLVTPATLKVWATGSGATRGENKVTKDKVIRAVIAAYGRFLNINPSDDNHSDAVAMLTLTLARYGQGLGAPPMPRCHQALSVPEWPELAVAS